MITPNGHKKRIGLVLSAVPGYSETFFRNKIAGLQACGYEVVLFVDDIKSHQGDYLCKVVAAPDFSGSFFRSLKQSFWPMLQLIFQHPNRGLKLFRLDKKDGLSFIKRIKHVLRNAALLTQNLGWLHFGFGMLAVDRENVAAAIGAKMGVSFRGFDLYLSPLKHKNCYQHLFKKNIRYHVLSEEMKTDLKKQGVSGLEIQVITPAIDVDYFQNDKTKPNHKQIKFVTVARLHWKKGLVYTLEALALLKQQGTAFEYTIIGDGIEYERLVFAAHQLDILDCVKFTGKLPQDAVKAHLEKSDIYLQYSIQEGFCNAVLEAQAMGLLCVVSNAEGLSENVLDGITGWVVPKRQPDLLAQKLKSIFKLDETETSKIKARAMDRVKLDFNLEQQQAAFVNFYN